MIDARKLAAFGAGGKTEPREFPGEDIASEAEAEGEPLEEELAEHWTPEEMERLRSPEVNYMELREPAGAFSCGNCSWVGEDGEHGESRCTHPKVDAPVSAEHGCSNLFDPASGPPAFPPDWEAPE